MVIAPVPIPFLFAILAVSVTRSGFFRFFDYILICLGAASPNLIKKKAVFCNFKAFKNPNKNLCQKTIFFNTKKCIHHHRVFVFLHLSPI